jgi:hypothetical protein
MEITELDLNKLAGILVETRTSDKLQFETPFAWAGTQVSTSTKSKPPKGSNPIYPKHGR